MIRHPGCGRALQFPFLRLLLSYAFAVKGYIHWAISGAFTGYNSLQWPLGCNMSPEWGCIFTTLLPAFTGRYQTEKADIGTFA